MFTSTFVSFVKKTFRKWYRIISNNIKVKKKKTAKGSVFQRSAVTTRIWGNDDECNNLTAPQEQLDVMKYNVISSERTVHWLLFLIREQRSYVLIWSRPLAIYIRCSFVLLNRKFHRPGSVTIWRSFLPPPLPPIRDDRVVRENYLLLRTACQHC